METSLEEVGSSDGNGAKPLSSQSSSTSSVMASSTVQASNCHPSDSLVSEVIWLRKENARLNEKKETSNAELAFAHQQIAKQDVLISDQSKKLLEAQKEIEKLNQTAIDLKRKIPCFVQTFVEPLESEEKLGNIPNSTDIDQYVQYSADQEKDEHGVSDWPAERKLKCMATFLEMYQKNNEENAMKWQAWTEAQDKKVGECAKKSRKSADNVSAPVIQPYIPSAQNITNDVECSQSEEMSAHKNIN